MTKLRQRRWFGTGQTMAAVAVAWMVQAAAAASSNSAVICPVVQAVDTATTIDTFDPVDRFTELSGLALSSTRYNNGNPVLYGVNDIGHEARLGVFDSATGQRLISLRVPEANNGAYYIVFALCMQLDRYAIIFVIHLFLMRRLRFYLCRLGGYDDRIVWE